MSLTGILPRNDALLQTLLPPNSTKLEYDLELTGAAYAPALQASIERLWNADTCPAQFLPALAWALSIDDWDDEWSEQLKRQTIKEAPFLHSIKGTIGAVKLALARHGHDDSVVIERYQGGMRYSGQYVHDGTRLRGNVDGLWATYKVILKKPITRDQALKLRKAMFGVKRNCVHLVEIDFTAAAYRHNDTINRNGSTTYGAVA